MSKQIPNPFLWLIVWLFLVLTAGCGPNKDAVAATIEHQVSQVLEQTMEARPVATSQPSLTPQPTFTAQATHTAQPSLTPEATQTLLPTYTPAPTLTPLPTATPTPTTTVTNTPLPRPVATAQPAVNVAAALLQEVNLTITQIETFRANIPPICPQNAPLSACNQTVDCPSMVNQYDSITAPLVLNITGSSQEVQNAYAGYQNGLIVFGDRMRDWISSCRQAISSGTAISSNWSLRNTLYSEVNKALDVLYPVKQTLDNIQ